MLAGYLVMPRFGDDGYAGAWSTGERPTDEEWMPLHAVEPLSHDWVPRAWKWVPADGPHSDVEWGPGVIVVDDATVNRTVWDVLARCGEWLPLTGEAAGHSLFHHLVDVPVDRDSSTFAPDSKFTIETYSLDQTAVRPNLIARLAGKGIAWFDDDSEDDQNLRHLVRREGLTGIGFIKFWDETETYKYRYSEDWQ